MFRLDSVMQLKDEEQIKAMVRRHAVTLIGPLLLAMLSIVIPFFFLFPLFNLGIFGVIVFAVLIIIGAFLAFRTIFVWDNDVLIVTNLRIVDIDQHGLFSRHVSEANLSAIQDVSWKKQGFWQTLFRMGSVTVQTAGATATIQGDDLPRPEKIQNLINDTRHEAPSPTAPPQTPVEKDRRSRIRHIAAMLEEIKDEEVMEVENLLEKKTKEKSMQTLFNS
ncbi:MAG: PH domain-containing protein [Patescibacteria group bacterium]|nr:PH domain-containing protein [Patescibacteria group bacterium]